jgi:hypothetical protein
MIPSIRGGFLPESEADSRQLTDTRKAHYLACISCKLPFTAERIKTSAGWRETQISGMCEVCYDELFQDAQDSGVDTL